MHDIFFSIYFHQIIFFISIINIRNLFLENQEFYNIQEKS